MRTGRAWKTLTVLLVLIGLVALAAPAQAGDHAQRSGTWRWGIRCRWASSRTPTASITRPTNGYADQLYQALKATTPNLELKKLGCAVTETSEDMLKGPSDCRSQYKLRVQLADAVAFLLLHRGSVKLVTIDIGANDLEICASPTGIDPACVEDAFSDVAREPAQDPQGPPAGRGTGRPDRRHELLQPVPRRLARPDARLAHLRVANGILASFNGLLGSIYRLLPRCRSPTLPRRSTRPNFELVPAPPPVPAHGSPERPEHLLPDVHVPGLGNIHATTDGYGVITQAFLDVLP